METLKEHLRSSILQAFCKQCIISDSQTLTSATWSMSAKAESEETPTAAQDLPRQTQLHTYCEQCAHIGCIQEAHRNVHKRCANLGTTRSALEMTCVQNECRCACVQNLEARPRCAPMATASRPRPAVLRDPWLNERPIMYASAVCLH